MKGLALRVTFDTLPLFYSHAQNLRAYSRKNYATVEIHPYIASTLFTRQWTFTLWDQ